MKSPEGGLTADPVAGMVNGEWGFKNVDTSELTHAIHPYPARMVPQVARKVLETYATEDTLVWDPFCGSGTVLLEAMTRRNASIGTDLNPFACLLARAKTSPVPLQELLNWTDLLVKRLRGPRSDRARLEYKPILEDFTLDVEKWWKPTVVRDLGYIRDQLHELSHLGADDMVVNLFDVVFSWTVRQVSNQRRNEFKRYRRPAGEIDSHKPDVVSVFLRRWTTVCRMVGQLTSGYADSPRPDVEVADAMTYVPQRPVGLILTSPPYGDSTTTVAYGQYSSLMMEWLPHLKADWREIDRGAVGGDPSRTSEHASSETLSRVLGEIERVDTKRANVVESYFGEMRGCLRNMLDALEPRGYACIVIGDRTVREVIVPNAVILTEEATDLGFEPVEMMARRIFFKVGPYRVNPIGRTGKAQDTAAISKEHIIVLRAP